MQISPIVLSKCMQTSFGFGKDMSTQTEDEHKETWIQEHSMTLKTMMTNRWLKKQHLKQNQIVPLRTWAAVSIWVVSQKANFVQKRMMLTVTTIQESKHLLLSWFIGLRYCYFFKVASHVQQMLLLKSLHGKIRRF